VCRVGKILVAIILHDDKGLGLIGCGEQSFSLGKRNQTVRRAVSDDYRASDVANLLQIVELVARQPSGGCPGKKLLSPVRHRRKGADQHEGAVRMPLCQFDSDAATQRTTIEDDPLRLNLLVNQPVEAGFAGRVAAGLCWDALAAAKARVVKQQDG